MSDAALDAVCITEPGVYPDIPEQNYHLDPVAEGSLSTSGAKTLLRCPALFRWQQDNPRPDTKAFDIGKAAHKLVLGVGTDIEVIDAENYRTKDAQDKAKAARARGATPLLAAEMAEVQAMAEALRTHPLAGRLLQQGSGVPEASLFWRDEPTGVVRRARLDWLPNVGASGRLIIPDVKTSVSADPREFGTSAAKYGYDLQHVTYCEGVQALGIAEDVAVVFCVVEKTPPYLVSVVELDSLAQRIGRHRNRKAVDLYLECRTADHWPGYSDDVELVGLPKWAIYEYEEQTT